MLPHAGFHRRLRMRKFTGRTAPTFALVGLALTSSLVGQSVPLATLIGTMDPAPLGTAFFCPAGDWNSDGIQDFAGLRQFETQDHPPYRYEGVEVFDGLTLATLFYLPLPLVDDRRLSSAGDWNGDGRNEFLIGDPLVLRIQDVASGQIFSTFDIPINPSGFTAFSISELCFAEVTGDLVPDLCAVVWAQNSQPHLVVYSGASGNIHRYDPLLPDYYNLIRSLPDRNNDGRNELAVLCYCGPFYGDLRLRILDGSTGATLVAGPVLNSPGPGAWLGTVSDFEHDLNGDGIPDLAYLYEDDFSMKLSLLSGATGAELWNVDSVPFPGWRVWHSPLDAACIITDDHDNDGRKDILVASGHWPDDPGFSVPPYSRIHSSATGQTIRSVTHSFGDGMASSICPTVDVDGDGKVDTIAANSDGISIHSSLTGSSLTKRLRRVGSERLGSCIYIDDWDGDGILDLFVSTPGSAEGGTIQVYCGRDRSLLTTWFAPEPCFSFGSTILRVPDLNSDGTADYAVSAPDDHADTAYKAGLLYFLSGANGTLIWKLQGSFEKSHFGHALLLLPDIDADGILDLAVSAPSELGTGYYGFVPIGIRSLHFVSLGARQIVRTVYLDGHMAGKTLRLADDLDMDGLADVFVFIDYDPVVLWQCFLSPFFTPTPACDWGDFFTIISTGSGIALRGPQVTAPFTESSAAGLFDVDGDGHDEVITHTGCGINPCGPGISCHSTFDGSLKWTLPTSFGWADDWQILELPDLSNDGRPDWALLGESGLVHLFAGYPPTYHSSRVSSLPRIAKRNQETWTDQDNDGVPELVVPSWGPAPSEQVGPGEVRILSGADYSPASSIFGSGSPGGGGLEPKLRVLGHPPAVGEATFAIGLSHAAANAAVVLGISSALDSSPTSLLGASFYLDFTASSLLLDSVFRVPMPTAVNPTGVLRIPLPIPNSAAWHGLTLHFQAAVVDPNAANGIFSTTPVLSVSIP